MRVFCVLLLPAGVGFAADADKPAVDAALAKELAGLQGKWERTMMDAAGNTIRVVKQHTGNRTSVTTMTDRGETIAAHTSEFKLETRGAVRVFTYSRVKVVAGPEAGREHAGEFAYIYKVDGDTFVEAHGLLIGDESPISVLIWTRVKE
jgi:hypothetical protein